MCFSVIKIHLKSHAPKLSGRPHARAVFEDRQPMRILLLLLLLLLLLTIKQLISVCIITLIIVVIRIIIMIIVVIVIILLAMIITNGQTRTPNSEPVPCTRVSLRPSRK